MNNRCATKYCDCNARGVGCNPAVCNCINCANMMKPHSEMLDHELEPEVEEDETQVFIPSDVDATVSSKIKGLSNCECKSIYVKVSFLKLAHLS